MTSQPASQPVASCSTIFPLRRLPWNSLWYSLVLFTFFFFVYLQSTHQESQELYPAPYSRSKVEALLLNGFPRLWHLGTEVKT